MGPRNNKVRILLLSLLLVTLPCRQTRAEKAILADNLTEKMRGMWLGQLIGNYAGRETEGRYSGSAPNPDPAVPWQIRQEWDADDDTDMEYVALHILETHGLDCGWQEIADQWRAHVTSSGIFIANRQAWYLMEDGHLPPDTGSRTYNEHWYSIDSQITTESLGAVSPGLVQSAIDLAGRFARITNTGFPVHAAQFYSAMYATAFFEPNVVDIVTAGLNAIPETSRTHRVVADVLNWYLEDASDGHLDWQATRHKLYENYQGSNSYGRHYNWIESTINAGASTLAILYGQGDFKNTVQIAVLAGWDCDCNAATAGGLIGIMKGFSNLPSDLIDPNICGDVYKNVYRPYLPDPNQYLPQYDTITNIAARLSDLAEQNILGNGGYITGSGPTRTCHILDMGVITPEPEKPDPNGPAGLVAEALTAGITVTPTAATQRFDAGFDRHNLASIMDGITDNSYNGHKAYYSFTSPALEEDWYQLNFSEPVEFKTLTFWEGDVIWHGINAYYRDDSAQGGFFQDLTVEIMRDGKLVVPANLQMSPALDRFEMYQTITFRFAPTVGDSIRITGAPGGALGYTTIMELEVGGDLDPNVYVTRVEIAGGQIQRSSVCDVAVTFSGDVVVTRDGVQLIGTTNGTVLEAGQINLTYDSLSYRLSMKFDIDNDSHFGDSLPEDTYRLRIDCNSIMCPGGQKLHDDDGSPGDGYYTVEFHRLFGDADGSATIDFTDLAALASHWLGVPAETGLDSNLDNILDSSDLAALARNWLRSL
jgi:ADP-ribosylglycohydrolase